MRAGLDPEPWSAQSRAVGPSLISESACWRSAPALSEELGFEVGLVANVAGLAAEHCDLGVGEQIGREAALDGRRSTRRSCPRRRPASRYSRAPSDPADR
jgi:hypothetical protein